jgi:NADPH2:quinone reductase
VLTLANVALEESVIDARDFYPKNVTIYGFQISNLVQRLGYDPRGDLAELADLAARGKLEVHVDRVFSLEEAGSAHYHMEERRNRGKIMIHPAD